MLNFKGCSQENTEVYIVDFAVHDEDKVSGYPLSGLRGNYISSLLGSMSLLPITRIASWEGCGADIVLKDIFASQPKVIIGFGSELLKKFVQTDRTITNVSGYIYNTKIYGQEFLYLPLVSPSYILKRSNDTETVLKFSKDLYKAYEIVSGEYHDILKEKEILSAHSYEEFKEIYESRFATIPRIAYDIETTARPIFMSGGEIIGFSIGNKTSGVYVSIKSLEFEMPKEDVIKVWDLMKDRVFGHQRLIIHNTMYERPYTYYCQGYEIKYEDADDTLVMARLLKNPKESAGLKHQAQQYLGYPDWDADLGYYIEGFTGVVNRIGLGPGKYRPIWGLIKDNGVFSIFDKPDFIKLDEDDQQEILDIVDTIRNSFTDLYTTQEITTILEPLITEKLIEVVDQGGIKDSVIPYKYVPDRVLSKYGAVDSLATSDLCDYFEDIMRKESTDKVNLFKGYENWLEHMYVAYIMERNGIYWNEDLVKADEMTLTNQATHCLRSILLSPLFKPMVRTSCESEFKPLILADYLPNIAAQAGFKVDYNHDNDKYIVKYQGKRCSKSRLDEIEIPPYYEQQYNDLLYNMFKERVENATHFDQMKDYYNPASPSTYAIPRTILIDEDQQMGYRIYQLGVLASSPEFEEIIDSLPMVDQKFLKLASRITDVKFLKKEYGEDWGFERKELYKGFCSVYDALKNQVTTPEIKEIIKNKAPLVIDTFDDEGIINLYNAMVCTGIDPDKRTTWTPKFEWMINFRIFKKTSKILTTYVEGSVGKASVDVVDKEALMRGDHCVERKRHYTDDPTPYHTLDESHILAAKWSPNTAETGRWRSAYHTIPADSQVKKYYTSRFKGGTVCAPDYSTMEVRTLGAIAKDENMLELFRNNEDFHTATAASIYEKPKEEVTKAERRFSKTATFSLLYGSTAESFARKYFKGDVSKANQLYDGFFRTYPGVAQWIKDRHEEVQRDHRVSLELSNRFIKIMPRDDSIGERNALLRKGQNYPIQSQSADLTGCVIFDLQKFIEEENMKSLVIMYVHDSIEVDIYPYELIKFVSKLKEILNEAPMRRFGLPSKSDVTLGQSLGHEIEMKSLTYNEEMTDGVIELEGYKDEVYETINTWKEAYKTVEILEEEWEDRYVSMEELFILRKAYTPTFGTMRQTGKCKVHINYYE